MNSATEPVVAERTDPSAAGDTVRPSGAPTIVLWCAAILAAVMLIVAVAAWRNTPQQVSIHWGASPSFGGAVSPQEQRRDRAAAVHGRLLAPQADAMVSLGAQLDAPNFGRLGSPDRLDPEKIIPIDHRWQIAFAPGLTEGQYGAQLASLGMELGVLAKDGSLQYVVGLGDAGSTRRAGTRRDEKRPYWSWERGDLKQADQVLLANAGLPVTEELVLHFLPDETIEKLADLEKDFVTREPRDILLTRFALKRTFRGYELYVAEQIER